MPVKKPSLQNQKFQRQRGSMLVEIAVALVIIMLLATFAFPQVRGFLIEMRVPSVANELQRFMARAKILGEGDSVTPYANVDNTKNLVPALRDSTVLKVTGNTVAHRLGGTGVGSNGTITLEPVALGGGAAGSGFSITMTNVNVKACPILASTLNAVSEMISVNGTVAKALGTSGAPGSYNPATAQSLCTDGDSNTFVFAAR